MENCFWAEEHESWLPPAEEYGCYHTATMASPWDGDRTATASRSHSEAEKRRRDRINTQLASEKISPWHDIPLHLGDGVFNFVVEISKESSAEMEVGTDEVYTPIKQDTKKGKL
ncbi:hypothetical protein ACS0TY_003627 [Phlomoides rotata]